MGIKLQPSAEDREERIGNLEQQLEQVIKVNSWNRDSKGEQASSWKRNTLDVTNTQKLHLIQEIPEDS